MTKGSAEDFETHGRKRLLPSLGGTPLARVDERRGPPGARSAPWRSKGRPRVSDEAWQAAPAIAKQAAVSASLQTIDAYARAASAAGGFDHGNSHLTRTQLTLDARGWNDLSRACLRILDQVNRIEDAAKERLELNPHSGDTKDVALVVMLFEAARLAVETEGDPVAERRLRVTLGRRCV